MNGWMNELKKKCKKTVQKQYVKHSNSTYGPFLSTGPELYTYPLESIFKDGWIPMELEAEGRNNEPRAYIRLGI